MTNLRRLLLQPLLGRRLPITSGRLWLSGLNAPLTIRRDRYAIPYIDAENDADAWFGLGFCQAQDRAFQLELRLRTVRGTLAALFGPQTLSIDRLSRRIGFIEASRRQLDALDVDVHAQVEAFVRGINAGLEAGTRRRAHEFTLLRAKPSLWEPVDVVGVAKLMSFLLIGNWDVELARLKILTEDGPQALRDLDPTYPATHPVARPPGEPAGPALDRLSDDLAAFLAFAGPSSGSNSWALAGSRTASGRSILANDPHLEPTLPPHWYLAHLSTPDWQVAGASLVGAPATGAGHNGFAAWGLTAGLVDTVDLFVEELGPDGKSVRRGDEYVPCEMRQERIQVRRGEDVVEGVLITPHGPLIGPALTGEVGAISMKAVWLDAKPARGFLTVVKARSFEAFRKEFEAWPMLSQNVVYADEAGTIAWLLVGDAPRRRKGWGTLPLSGADPDAGWYEEGVPFSQMPSAVNPEAGFVASANAKPIRDTEEPYLGVDWLDGYRMGRIVEALRQRTDWDRDATLRLQIDETSLAWREVRGAILAIPPSTEEARLAATLLRDWDGIMSVDSAAASVFSLFTAEMWRRIARARAPKSAQYALGRGFSALLPVTTFAGGRWSTVYRHLVEQPDGWFERPWPEEMADALAWSVRQLSADFGIDPAKWGWGHIRRLTLVHPLSVIKPLAPLLNRGPFPWGGDANTISQAGALPLRMPSNPGVIASLRMVVDVGDWDQSRFALPGGQSGNPFSPHYDDLLPLWLRGEGVPIAWSPLAVAEAARTTLNLLPLAPDS